MKSTTVRNSHGRLAIALMAGFALTGVSSVLAQSTDASAPAAPAAQGSQVTKLSTYVVTGSYIPLSEVAPPIPVQGVSSDDIANTGESGNLLNVLTKVSPAFGGNLNLGPTNGNISSNSTNGGSSVALRNLPTLVLINGHRVASSPVGSVGGISFVDLNTIPVSAIDKVEILTDGASAIYGSDAVGGVVNIILKSNFNGFEMGTTYNFAPNLVMGHWTEREAYVSGGFADAKNSVFISAEWMKSDPLYQAQVSTSKYVTGTTNYPGVINIGSAYYKLASGVSVPAYSSPTTIAALLANGTYTGPYTSTQIISGFNLASKPTSLIGDERKSFTANWDHIINDNIKFDAAILYSQTDTFSQLNANPISQTVAAGGAYNPLNVSVKAHDRFADFPRQFYADTPSIQGTLDLTGKIADGWSWRLATDYSDQREHYQNKNLVLESALNAALAANEINLFARSLPDSYVSSLGVFATAFGEFDSSLLTDSFVVNGDLFKVPAGTVQIAAGAEFRREGYSANADPNSIANAANDYTTNWASGTTISPLTVSRNIGGEFAQIVIPIVSPSQKIPFVYSLSSTDAVRHEIYQGITKQPTVPLLTLRWQPFDEQLTIRSSYTKSFIAPTLYSLYGPTNVGYTLDLTNFKEAGGAIDGNDGQANIQTLANPNLKPSSAETFTLGFVWSPKFLKGFSATMDYFRIRQSDIVYTPDVRGYLQDVELKGTKSVWAKYVTLNDWGNQSDATPITAPGQISSDVSNVYFNNDLASNGSWLKEEGADLALDYSFETSFGTFTLGSKESYNEHYYYYPSQYFPSYGPDQIAGKATTYNGTVPRWRGYTTAEYSFQGWDATLGFSYIPALTDADDGEHINAYYTTDASVGYTFRGSETSFLGKFKGLKVTVGCKNVFNRQPSTDYDTFSTDNADISTYSPLGRTVYTSLTYKF